MKKTLFAFLFLGAGVLTITSCNKNNTEINPPPVNIADYIAGNPDFSMMESALVRSGLATQIENATDITFLLPDNAALQNAGIDQNYLNNLSTDDLTQFVLYHEIDKKISSVDFPISDTISTVSNLHIFSSMNDNGIFINGILLKQTDIQATNGLVHLLTKALVPPETTLYNIIAANPDLTLMKAAIDKAGLASTLQNGGKYTVFAPTNTAFNNAGYMTVTDINNADAAVITKIVKDQILPTEFFNSDFIAGITLKNLQGDDLLVNAVPPSLSLVGSAQPPSTITTFDILGTNGVEQVIDRVILP
ncbi:MAG: fasciclin domain-containing protein [Bacteroidetes bacterium]|nr:fasciclin domain-containing protein [Bacteroidota bacterium]